MEKKSTLLPPEKVQKCRSEKALDGPRWLAGGGRAAGGPGQPGSGQTEA